MFLECLALYVVESFHTNIHKIFSLAHNIYQINQKKNIFEKLKIREKCFITMLID